MSLICSACNYSIHTADKNIHYNTEWHKYNIKRKCANLMPISYTIFNNKLESLKLETKEKEIDIKCEACNKWFRSKGTYETHLEGKKHKENESSYVPKEKKDKNDKNELITSEADRKEKETTPGDEEEQEEEGQPLPLTTCLFCSQEHTSLDDNLAHMKLEHSFFIPFKEYLEDLNGLIEYLDYKIGMGRVCLYCNGRGKQQYSSVAAVQQHMMDKGHCKIRFEDEDEEEDLLEFYNFSPVETALVTHEAVTLDSGELQLPNGTIIGNRSLALYYRQQARVSDVRESVQAVLLNRLTYNQPSVRIDEVEWKRSALRYKEKLSLKVGIIHNIQKHYRNQNPM